MIGFSHYSQINVHIWILEKNNVGENQYYTTMNNVTKTIDIHDKQKDLGVTFDTKLTFDQHISQVVNKATKMTKIIRRTFQFLGKHTFCHSTKQWLDNT